MLITPRPGNNAESILQSLSHVHGQISNLRSGPSIRALEQPAEDARRWLLDYLEWATQSVEHLRYAISDADIDRLILTRRYYELLGAAARPFGDIHARLINGLVSLETAERTDALGIVVAALKKSARQWSKPGRFVVADTSFYLHNEKPLRDADLHDVLDLRPYDHVHLLFPIVVVDELDKLKESGKNHARWRAGHTLGLLDGLIGKGTTGILRRFHNPTSGPEELIRGEVSVEIVLDPPRHVRLPLEDDEIIDRAAAIQALAGRDVLLLTADTGQATRGRMAGLTVKKITSSAGTGEEPPPDNQKPSQQRGNGSRGQRKDRRDAEADDASAL
ncbi:PIN domain-containing protein [Streptomyces sp. NBC_01476]|uniref:PIN domain-containing protein n=1 Tax=Streptomyces sp. NBC_01476 TaxID=2903881 RepID=UPI002E2FF440|nr:PIN domain-containing protein [Streptomyces sp. NBC_01476]